MKFFKNYFPILIAVLVAGHLLLILLHTLPESLTPKIAKSISGRYVQPLFEQQWSLFVPSPTEHRTVWVSKKLPNDKWSTWENPFLNAFTTHQNNRFSPAFRIALAINSTLHLISYENDLDAKVKCKLAISNGNPKSGYFRVLKFALQKFNPTLLNPNDSARIFILLESSSLTINQCRGILFSVNASDN